MGEGPHFVETDEHDIWDDKPEFGWWIVGGMLVLFIAACWMGLRAGGVL